MASFFNTKGTTQGTFQIGIKGPIIKRKVKEDNTTDSTTIILPNNTETQKIIFDGLTPDKTYIDKDNYTGNSASATKLLEEKTFSFKNGITLDPAYKYDFDGRNNLNFYIKSLDATFLEGSIPWESLSKHGGTAKTNFALGDHNHDNSYLPIGTTIKSVDNSQISITECTSEVDPTSNVRQFQLDLSLTDDSVKANHINNNSITVNKIANNAVTVDKISSGDYSTKIQNVKSSKNVSETINNIPLTEIFEVDTSPQKNMTSKVKSASNADNALNAIDSTNSENTNKFKSVRDITLSGEVLGTASSDGSNGWAIKDITLSTTGVIPKKYGPASDTTLKNGGTFIIPSYEVDAKGRLTSSSDISITLPTIVDTYVSEITWSDASTDQLKLFIKNNNNKTIQSSLIPSASDTQSGVITKSAQTIGGLKTFKNGIKIGKSNTELEDTISGKHNNNVIPTQGYVDDSIKTAIDQAELNAMEFKGVLEINNIGTPELPEYKLNIDISNVTNGNFYKIGKDGDYSSLISADFSDLHKGDSLIYHKDKGDETGKWELIPSGDDQAIKINGSLVSGKYANFINSENTELEIKNDTITISSSDTKNTIGNKLYNGIQLYLAGTIAYDEQNINSFKQSYINSNIFVTKTNLLHAELEHGISIGDLTFDNSKKISINAGSGLAIIDSTTDSNTATISHTNVLSKELTTTAQTNTSLGSGTKFKVPNITTDINGHLTSLTEAEFTMPTLSNYVSGPALSITNAIPVFINETGKQIKNTGITIDSNDVMHATKIKTGESNDSYFQSRRFRGEGDASSYQHAIDFGYAGHNQIDFYESGATWNFWKNQQKEASTTQSALILGITETQLKHKDKTYDYPDNSGTIALVSDIDSKINTNNANYLPLYGGEMTGPITIAGGDGKGILFKDKTSNINIIDGNTRTLVGFLNNNFTLGYPSYNINIRGYKLDIYSAGNAGLYLKGVSANTDYAKLGTYDPDRVFFIQPGAQGTVTIGGNVDDTSIQADKTAKLIVHGDIKENGTKLFEKYSDINTKSIINTNNSESLQVNSQENIVINGQSTTINLHKISKTGSYTDLNDKPIIVLKLSSDSGTLTEENINAIKNSQQIVYIKINNLIYRKNKEYKVLDVGEVIDYIAFDDNEDIQKHTKKYLLRIDVATRRFNVKISERFALNKEYSESSIFGVVKSATEFLTNNSGYAYFKNGSISKDIITKNIDGGVIASGANINVGNSNKNILINSKAESAYNKTNEVILQATVAGDDASTKLYSYDSETVKNDLGISINAAARVDKVFDIIHNTRANTLTFGGIKLFDNALFATALSDSNINKIASDEVASSNKNYAVQLDQTGRAFVNVPWKEIDTSAFVKTTDLSNYVTLLTPQIITGNKTFANDDGLKISNAGQTGGSASMKYNSSEECLEFVFA